MTIRRRLTDAPMCKFWNAQIRAARDAQPVAWCQWVDQDGKTLCCRPADGAGLCSGHRMVAAKNRRAA